MHLTVKNFIELKEKIKGKISELKFEHYNPSIIAVSKTFKLDHIIHLIDYGHQHFGENKVQEAVDK